MESVKRERDSRFTLPPQFASHSVRDSRRAGRATCRPQMRSSKKPSSSQAQKRSPHKRGNKGWVAGVKTVSTLPPKALFTKDAHTIAKSLASKKVSPKGPGSGMRVLTYFMNRAGRGLSPSRRKVLERAKRILSQRTERQKIHKRRRAA
jgi:tRNA(adenine34) deaminase